MDDAVQSTTLPSQLPVQPPIPPAPSPKKTKTLLVALVVIVLLGVGSAGGYLFATRTQPTPATENHGKQSSKKLTLPTPTPDPKADWKLYSYPGLSISFKYPPTVEVEGSKQRPDSDTEINHLTIYPTGKIENKVPLTGINIWIEDNPQSLSSSKWLTEDKAKDPRLTEPAAYKNTLVNNYDAVTDLHPLAFDHRVINNYIIAYKNKAYFISFDKWSELGEDMTYPGSIDESTFNEIMTTISFK